MPTPSELLRSATSTMNALAEHFEACDEITEKAKRAQTQLDAVVLEYSQVSDKLRTAKAELAVAEQSLQKKHHIINDEKARALQNLDEQIAQRIVESKKIDAQIAEKRKEHDNVIAGMDALLKRLKL